jgi:hypothetical protein
VIKYQQYNASDRKLHQQRTQTQPKHHQLTLLQLPRQNIDAANGLYFSF